MSAGAATARMPTGGFLTPTRRAWRIALPEVAYTSHVGGFKVWTPAADAVPWPRGVALSLAVTGCPKCRATGMVRHDHADVTTVCRCVLRAVFRRVLSRYRKIQERHEARALYVGPRGQPDIEFMADFEQIARRHLTDQRWHLFREYIVRGREWSEVAPEIGLDRGNFYHELYRVEEILGGAFYETRPYGLFPCGSYFSKCS